MEKMIVSIEWEGLGPRGPKEIREVLESHYKQNITVRCLDLEAVKQPEKLAYNVNETASLLGISKTTVYALINQKQIPSIQYGKRLIIPKAALEKQLGGDIQQNKREYISKMERAELLAIADEALKLYDLLRGKLIGLVKHLKEDSILAKI